MACFQLVAGVFPAVGLAVTNFGKSYPKRGVA
jgi:hypothetical protein